MLTFFGIAVSARIKRIEAWERDEAAENGRDSIIVQGGERAER